METTLRKKTVVYVDMVADLFHYGHVNILMRARNLGDVLKVGIHSDETVASYKRVPILTMQERIEVVNACKFVDCVIPDAPLKVTKEYLKHHDIDLVVLGDTISEENKNKMYGEILDKIMLLPYTTSISTTQIMKRVRSR